MSTRAGLLATASWLAMLGAASAANVPVTKAPAAVPLFNWTGFYSGVSLGVARHKWSATETTDVECAPTCSLLFRSWDDSKTGWILDLHAGYNRQSGNFVYGFEADLSWLGVKKTAELEPVNAGSGQVDSLKGISKIDWLATFRGRAGGAVDRTMAYVTAGLAVARVHNGFSGEKDGGTPDIPFKVTSKKTKVGWAAGVGVEHFFSNPHWSARAELLYVDLGRSTAKGGTVGGGAILDNIYSASFVNRLLIGRLGLSYKW